MTKPNAAATETPAAEGASAPQGVSKIKIIGIVLAVMIAECIAIVMMLPGGAPAPAAAAEHGEGEDSHAAAAGKKDEHGDAHGDAQEDPHGEAAADAHGDAHGKGHGKEKGHGKKDDKKSAPPKAPNASEEVDLGEFSVTSYQPAANTTVFISFHLYGTLLHKNNEELNTRLEDNKHRVRDNIIVIIRSAEIADLTDAGLGLIKRRILETTNKTLGKPLLQAVVFSDFSFVEQ